MNLSILNESSSEEVLAYQLAASTSQLQSSTQQQPLPKTPLNDLVNWKDVPDKYLWVLANYIIGRFNDTRYMDRLNGPILKSTVDSTYWIFLIQYAALSMLGIVMNVAIIAYIMYHRLYRDVTNAFIVNLALCHFIQCAVVLPLSLMVMIIQNWIFGQFLCFFLPMLQDIPLHVALISHILIAWDRMRWLRDPMRGRFPAFVCCCATWLTGMVIALPYPIYMMYVEIGDFVPSLSGIGICVVNLMDDMHEYMRGLFVIMYCGPTVFMAYLYVKTSQELRPPEGPLAVMMFEHRAGVRQRQQRNSSTSSADRSFSALASGANGGGGGTSTTSGIGTITTHTSSNSASTVTKSVPKSLTRSYDLYNAELDVNREKRKQRNFGSMAAAQVLCLCPLMVLRFARLSMEETYENQKHIDYTYLMFVWIAFLPTVIFPSIYASQILPRAEQERLRGYFRLSSKRLKISRSVGAGVGGADDTAPAYGNAAKLGNRNSSTDRADDSVTGSPMVTSIISAGGSGFGDGDGSCSLAMHASNAKSGGRHDLKAGSKHHGARQMGKSLGNGKHSLHSQHGNRNGGNSGGGSKMNDIKINVIADDQSKANGGCETPTRLMKSGRKASAGSCSNNGSVASCYPPHGQRKLTLDSLDMSASNITASTYCIGNGNSFVDDGGTSNFGDGEDSSVTYGGSEKKWGGRHKDSISDCDTLSRLDSSSTLARDMEMMDLLERERSLNERDRHGDGGRSGRRLPDLEKIYQLSPKKMSKHDVYTFDGMPGSTTSTSASTLNGQDSHTLSTSMPTDYDPLQSLSTGGGRHDAYSAASTLPEEQLQHNPYAKDKSSSSHPDEDEEEVPSDFYDNYTPGSKEPLPNSSASSAQPLYQYQYSRRLSRNSSHHSQGSASHHRNSKRDSFNSLNGSDLIAGAFGELDPTQPLTKMSVIESRMRRSSGRTSSFSSSGRSSMKSRDYSHGSSSHSAHPELDFRENIFAEL